MPRAVTRALNDARYFFFRALRKAGAFGSGVGWSPELRGLGIEIGAHGHPLPGIQPYYVDRFRAFGGEPCAAHLLSDGASLPFRDGCLDYVACSHLLEHLADPAGAIVEWCRAVKPGGIVYLIVPDRRFTFDRHRPRTKVAHLIDDFERKAQPSDPTHIDEFFDRVALRELQPELERGEVAAYRERQRAHHHQEARAGRPVNIHFHAFEKADVLDLLRALAEHPAARLRYEVLEERAFFPPGAANGFLVAIRKRA